MAMSSSPATPSAPLAEGVPVLAVAIPGAEASDMSHLVTLLALRCGLHAMTFKMPPSVKIGRRELLYTLIEEVVLLSLTLPVFVLSLMLAVQVGATGSTEPRV
jgi:hypothetical protein